MSRTEQSDAARGETTPKEPLARLVPLLSEIGDLKRLRAAGRAGTHAEGVFRRSWAALLAGEPADDVARREAAAGVAAARMGSRDYPMLRRAGLSDEDSKDVLAASLDSVADALPEETRDTLRSALYASPIAQPPDEGELPTFVGLLARQPRAGATAPGKPRIVVEPPEGHADHCAAVALYAVLLAPLYGAESGAPFLVGLAHHLHNAYFPDSGFAGDDLLGDRLDVINSQLQGEVLEEIGGRNPALAEEVSGVLPLVYRTDTPEAKAFQAADVLDRILEQRHHARKAAFTLEDALGEMALVHEGPTQAFHLEVLDGSGLG